MVKRAKQGLLDFRADKILKAKNIPKKRRYDKSNNETLNDQTPNA